MRNYESDGVFSLKERIIGSVLNFCEHHSSWSGFAGGVLLGLVVNASSDPSIRKLPELLDRLFNISRPLNWLTWIAVGTMVMLSLGRVLLRWYSRKQSYEIRLAHLYRNQVDVSLLPFQRGRFAWGKNLTLQSSPDMQEGWRADKVNIQHDISQYVLSSDLNEAYKHYVETEFCHKFQDDRVRLMLIETPVSFSDLPTLRLKIRQTKWSQLRFYQDTILKNTINRNEHIEQVLNGKINFPNSLALLLVVATSDGYVLLTQTSPNVHYYAGHWACSIGEHLDITDMKGAMGSEKPESIMLNWVERALWEELGVTKSSFSLDNIRIMAVIMESQIVNFSLVGVVILNYDRSNLDAIIDKHPRTDNEFQNWDFVAWDEIPRELITPTRNYHPSTSIRMFYAGLFRFGVSSLGRQLMFYLNSVE